MTTYYAKPENPEQKGRRKFLYVILDQDQADMIEKKVIKEINGHRLQPRKELHDHGIEYHLTTDGAFKLYCQKRLETPQIVYILDTQAQVDSILEPLGFML